MNPLSFVQGIRQNHALEHATIHVLSERFPHRGVMGRSTPGGFYIYGRLSTGEVESAAQEALARLEAGEAHLAVHPRCGTNLAVTSILAGTAAYGATMGRSRSKLERLPLALIAATLASLAAQPLGLRVQQELTTTPDVEGVRIAGISRQVRGSVVIHKVVTARE
jgi:hypothetical protein